MKKYFLAVMFSLFALSVVTMAGSKTNYEPDRRVIESFKKDFPSATQVSWQSANSLLQIARFVQNNRAQLAYYKDNGEYIGQVWIVEIADLPKKVKEEVINLPRESVVKSVHLFFPPDGFPLYYATIESNGKTVIREIDSKGRSSVVSKKRVPIF